MSHMAKDFGSSSRRVKGRILIVFVLSRNAEDGPKDKQDGTFISSPILIHSPLKEFSHRPDQSG